MEITYGKTAYITVEDTILRQVKKNLVVYASGSHAVCTDLTLVKEYIKKKSGDEFSKVLSDLIEPLENGVDDIVFLR